MKSTSTVMDDFMARDDRDRLTTDMLLPRSGRPHSSPLNRKEQLREATKRANQAKRDKGLDPKRHWIDEVSALAIKNLKTILGVDDAGAVVMSLVNGEVRESDRRQAVEMAEQELQEKS